MLFTNKTTTISSQFSAPHTQELKPTTSTDKTPLFSFWRLTEAEVSKLQPTAWPLDPIPSHLLQAISHILLQHSKTGEDWGKKKWPWTFWHRAAHHTRPATHHTINFSITKNNACFYFIISLFWFIWQKVTNLEELLHISFRGTV